MTTNIQEFRALCQEGDAEGVRRRILEQQKQNAQQHQENRNVFLEDKSDEFHQTPLSLCCKHGHLELARMLIEDFGCDINATNKNGCSILFVSVFYEHADIVKLLLSTTTTTTSQQKIDINATTASSHQEKTAFYQACENNRVEMVRLLLAECARLKLPLDVNKAQAEGWTPLYAATCAGHAEIVRLLLNQDNYLVDVNARDKAEGATCLYFASFNGNLEIVQALLEYSSCDPNMAENSGATPLFAAAQNNHVDVLRALLQHPRIQKDQAECSGATPLYIACQLGNTESVRVLLGAGAADKNHRDNDGRSCLFSACFHGHIETVRVLLVDHDADPFAKDDKGGTPLYVACMNGHLETATLLCDHVAKKEKQQEAVTASTTTSPAALSSLVNVALTTQTPATPLTVACERGHIDVVKMLVTHAGADVEVKVNGWTPISIACATGSVELVRFLKDEAGASTKWRLALWRSLRFFAADRGFPEVAALFEQSSSDDDDDGDNNAAVDGKEKETSE